MDLDKLDERITETPFLLPNRAACLSRQYVSDNHRLEFFAQKKNNNTVLGYYELSGDEMSGFQTVCSTAYSVVDCSFLVTQNAVHSLFVIKSLLTSRLIYRRRGENGFSEPVLLMEGQRIGECALFILKGVLHAVTIFSGNPYVCKSADFGESFGRAALYKQKFCKEPKKKQVNFDREQCERYGLSCVEVFVDANRETDIQILPDLI